MTLNISNLDRLISYLEVVPPEEFNMAYVWKSVHPCGTACCISGHIEICSGNKSSGVGNFLNIPEYRHAITMPGGWENEKDSNKAYPLSRAIRMLRHLRAEFLRTGTVVVDWDAPEATETLRKPWAPPVVIGADKPLPDALTGRLRNPVASSLATEI